MLGAAGSPGGLAEMTCAEPSSGTSQEGTLGGSVAAMQCWELGRPSAPAVFNLWINRLEPSVCDSQVLCSGLRVKIDDAFEIFAKNA